MAKLIYQPLPDDQDTATVDGLTFDAYQAVDVDDAKSDLVAKLKRNPWFALDVPDPDRFLAWKTVRDAQSQAASHRAVADHLEEHPEAAAAHADAVGSQADSMLADARAHAATAIAQARELVARAQSEADSLIAAAHAEADAILTKANAEAAAVKTAAGSSDPPQSQSQSDPNSALGGGNP